MKCPMMWWISGVIIVVIALDIVVLVLAHT